VCLVGDGFLFRFIKGKSELFIYFFLINSQIYMDFFIIPSVILLFFVVFVVVGYFMK
jgi:hypothetical protein